MGVEERVGRSTRYLLTRALRFLRSDPDVVHSRATRRGIPAKGRFATLPLLAEGVDRTGYTECVTNSVAITTGDRIAVLQSTVDWRAMNPPVLRGQCSHIRMC